MTEVKRHQQLMTATINISFAVLQFVNWQSVQLLAPVREKQLLEKVLFGKKGIFVTTMP